MAYNILGINPGHNGSVALLSDGELVYYIEEERLTRSKYDGNPFRAIVDIIDRGYHIDEVAVAGTVDALHSNNTLAWSGENIFLGLVRKFFPKAKINFYNASQDHHLSHAACAFYNSGFDEAISIVVDGCGNYRTKDFESQGIQAEGYEAESIWAFQYPDKISTLYRSHGHNMGPRVYDGFDSFDCATTITKTYEAVTGFLGFDFIEAGKTMGLAPYGKKDDRLPPLFVGQRGNKNVFLPFYPSGAFIDSARNEILQRDRDPKEWHRDPSKLTDIEKNLAWQVQNDTQEMVKELISEAVKATGIKNVVLAGGYGLNCVANYYYKKSLPDVNIYCEPVSHDGGTSIGAALLSWHSKVNEPFYIHAEPTPHKNIYYGPEYDVKDIKKALDSNKDKIKTKKVSYDDVAKIIADKNIVALYQGRSEAGPRALGNRSILYDPRDPDGKDHVNTVKGREWFRPFAGTVLKEHANDWFDMAGMDESPFMMYAVNVAADKLKQIPSICHVDDTCRVQTVSKDQNEHYYNLINAFYQITNVPVIFNTSFNLAGDPLVETIDDALNTIYNSDIKYLYLPELELLVEKV